MQNIHVVQSEGRADRLVLLDRLLLMAHISIVCCLVSNERRHPVRMHDTPIIHGYRACEICDACRRQSKEWTVFLTLHCSGA